MVLGSIVGGLRLQDDVGQHQVGQISGRRWWRLWRTLGGQGVIARSEGETHGECDQHPTDTRVHAASLQSSWKDRCRPTPYGAVRAAGCEPRVTASRCRALWPLAARLARGVGSEVTPTAPAPRATSRRGARPCRGPAVTAVVGRVPALGGVFPEACGAEVLGAQLYDGYLLRARALVLGRVWPATRAPRGGTQSAGSPLHSRP